ncbi:hypothetical protein [Verrucomicrobium sp. BvORR034]|uniref:hypothetical protein n=1 Tax=Verrucomicrobium sp. BvORR034 TaxID=1396418 RepID=UPI000678E5A9|nr:hypothetical protein [Verrucomicrobium sp. BvORR034]
MSHHSTTPSQLALEYTSLFHHLHKERESFGEKEIGDGHVHVGRHYSNRLLVVGRASYGINRFFYPHETENIETITSGHFPSFRSQNLDWLETVGDETRPGGAYNPNRSAFWRCTRQVAAGLADTSEDPLHQIATTNLYKIAPDSGNPSSRLQQVQLDHCIRILQLEIALLKPANVVFLTGWDWIKDFTAAFGIKDQLDLSLAQFLDVACRVDGVNYILSQHPERKAEAPHVEEILSAVKTLNAQPAN